MTSRCTWDAARGWLTPEHLADCDTDCAGCRPCSKSHCELNGCATHVDQAAGIYTCPSCIGKTRRTIKAILIRYAELPAEYEYSGVESEPLNLHGPAADPGQWAARRAILTTAYAERGWCDYPKHAGMVVDEHHPLTVLGRWDMAIRESYGHTTDLFVTISRAVDYLAGDVLDTFAHTREFEEFAGDVKRCLTHLEDVLALSQRPERGAPCSTCAMGETGIAPRLEKRLAEHHPKMANGAVCETLDCSTCAGHRDTWHCPTNPEHWWTNADYRNRVDGDHLAHAAMLTMSDLPSRTGIAPGTLRRWASRTYLGTNDDGEPIYGPPKLKPCGRTSDGRRLYSVTDALALRPFGVSIDITSTNVSKSG